MTVLNIAFFGSSLVSAYWNGAATYYRGIVKALADQGHKVTFFEPDAYERQKHRDIDDPDWATVVVYQPEISEVYRVLEKAGKADLIIKASGVGIFDELLEKEVLNLKKSSNTVIFWDVDAPATLDRINSNSQDQFNQLVPKYDFILTYGGGPPVVKAYQQAGAKQCAPIYNALDPDTHYPVKPKPEFAGNLAFLGNRLPDREARVDEFFLAVAQKLPDKNFLIGGNGWNSKQLPDNVVNLGHVYTRDHNAFNCTPDMVLNISRESMASYGYSPATRVFEAVGAGACLITDYWAGIDTFFEPEKEILVARNGQEVAAYLDSVSPVRAREIGQAALKRVLAEHTYKHRVIQLEELLGVNRAVTKGSVA